MITISSAPTRLCLFGGGTDVNPFAETYGGAVVNFAINYRTTIRFFDETIEVTKDFKSKGLGGSASYFVALCAGLNKERIIDRMRVADQAFRIETEILGWHGGRQDQYASALGGFNLMEFGNGVQVTPLPKDQIEGFLPWLVLYDIGGSRDSFNVQHGFLAPTKAQMKALMEVKELAYHAGILFNKKKYEDIGRLLAKAWEAKKKSNRVTNKTIDGIYAKGLKNGALGGKLMGAGQGGHFLFAVHPGHRDEFVEKMGLKEVEFQVDYNGVDIKKICGE